jgi:hypothetical protein
LSVVCTPDSKLARRLNVDAPEANAATAIGCLGACFVPLVVGASIAWGSVPTPILIVFGLGLFAAVRFAMISKLVEPTVVEVSEISIFPGTNFDVWVCQTGDEIQINRIAVVLVRVDRESYTDSEGAYSTNTKVVVQTPLVERTRFRVTRAQPGELSANITLPVDALRDPQPAGAEILWEVHVELDIARCPHVTRRFPLNVVA